MDTSSSQISEMQQPADVSQPTEKSTPGKKIKLLFIGVAVFIFFLLKQLQAKKIVINNFPIWKLANGAAIYREIEISPGKVKKTIFINLPEGIKEPFQVYEVIPKEMAQKASELSFSVRPEIIEDDPVILWNVRGGEKIRELSWWETATFLPRFGFFVAQLVGRGVVGEVTGACDTKVAQEWMQKRVFNREPNLVDCASYIEYINKEIQERETIEWQNKIEEVKVIEQISPGSIEYDEIKVKVTKGVMEMSSKETPATSTSSTSTSKISQEEAISAVESQYPKPLASNGPNWPAATCKEEDAKYDAKEEKWHVTCIRPTYPSAPEGRMVTCKAQWFFFTVDNNGVAEQVGWYTTCDGGAWTNGVPMWGYSTE